MILGDFNILLAIMDRATIQEIKKQRTLNQLIIIAVYKTLYKKITKYTFLSSARFPEETQIWPQIKSQQVLKNIYHYTIQIIFSNHNERKSEINNRKKTAKYTNQEKLNKTFLSNQQIKEELKEELENMERPMKTKIQHNKIYGTQ